VHTYLNERNERHDSLSPLKFAKRRSISRRCAER
jgi:hypothetical protein